MFLIIAIAMLVLICCMTLFGFYLWRKQWTPNKKKLVFSAVGSFIFFPALIPTGFGAIPMVNILVLIPALFVGRWFEMLEWYFFTKFFHLASYVITFVIFFGLSQIVFFTKKRIASNVIEKVNL